MEKDFTALRVSRQGDVVSATVQKMPFDSLPGGEVLIRVSHSSVNYKDALASTGKAKIVRSMPLTTGIDLAGEVLESSVSDLQPGAAVLVTGYDLGVSHDGGYAEYARVPAEWVVRLPEGLTPYTAMALGTAGFTVALCVHRMQQNGQRPEHGEILVTGASGGVGCIAVSLLCRLGYKVVCVSGKRDVAEWLCALGAERVISASDIDFEHGPLQKGKWGGGIDNVGGKMLAWLLGTTRPWGNVVSVGLAESSELRTTVMPFILRGVSLLGVSSANCPTALRRQLWQQLATVWRPDVDAVVTGKVGLSELPAVFDNMLAGRTRGRTVLDMALD